jgi:hypothetical protein
MKKKPSRRRPAPKEVAPEPSSQQRVTWLLDFLQRDVASLRVGELIDVGIDAVRYLLDPKAVISRGDDDADAVVFFKGVLEWEKKIGPPPEWIPLGDATGTEDITEDEVFTLKRPLLQAFQNKLRLGIQQLHEGQGWFPFDADMAPPKLLVQRREDGTLGRSYYAGPILPVLLASAIDLLTQSWPEIRRCKYEPCGKFFLPGHGRQLFHDSKCSGLYRWNRYIAEHPRDYKQEMIRRHELETKRVRTHGKKRTHRARKDNV